MNAKSILSFAAVAGFATVAALASTVASAQDGATNQVSLNAQESRPRAEVKAEALQARAARPTFDGDPYPVQAHSGLDAKTVRAEAVQALRLGQIHSGEIAQ